MSGKSARFLVLFVLPFLVSCASHPAIEAPPFQPLSGELPPPPLSRIAVPVTLRLDVLRDLAMRALPSPLAQGRVPVPVATELHYRAVLSGLDLSVRGDELTAMADVDISAGAVSRTPLAEVGLASCGEGREAPARVRFTMSGRLLWGEDGKLSWSRGRWAMQWLRPCELTALRIDLATVLGLPLLRGKVENELAALIEKRPESFAVRPVVEKAWTALSVARPVGAGAWLCVHPESLCVSGISGSGKLAMLTATVAARPELLVSGSSPEPSRAPLPPLRAASRSDAPGFALDLAVDIPLSRVDSLLTEQLAAHPWGKGGREAKVTAAKLYASGGRAVLALDLSKPFLGRVYVLGRPVFDTARDSLAFDSLDYSLSTTSGLARSADWLLHGSFRDEIAKAARLDLRGDLSGMRKRLSRLEFAAGNGVTVRGSVRSLVPCAADISASALRVHVRAAGELSVEVR